MSNAAELRSIHGGGTALAWREIGDGAAPSVVFFGRSRFADHKLPIDPPSPPWSPGTPTPPSLLSQHGFGFFAEPALSGNFVGSASECFLRFQDARVEGSQAVFRFSGRGLELQIEMAIDGFGVLTSQARLTNMSDEAYQLHRLSALCLPLPTWATQFRCFEGGVFREGHLASLPISRARIECATRDGRPGHAWNPFAFVCEPATCDASGHVIFAHLAHPGNSVVSVEQVGDQGAQLLLSEWLAPGEVTLEPGRSYQTPVAVAAVSPDGFNGISRQLHALLRDRPAASRPVHLNTWEALYMSVDEPTAMALADEAAALGVERFVLDDGWFKRRYDDKAGLGDWTPDEIRFPSGLKPLIDHVRGLGMSFGLWLEPEMINPDSDLFRAHPDWVLCSPGEPQPLWRNQLVLDLTKDEVFDHLAGVIGRLLTDHPIEYIKWDCNRGLFPANGSAGAQARRFLSLVERLRASFPHVMFETCASGGGRVDFATLRYFDRIWISDSTDPVERTRIQRSASLMIPPEMLGCHIGGDPIPATERSYPMEFRCLSALFGHLGLEFDPRSLRAEDRDVLSRAIGFYKAERSFMASAHLRRIDGAPPGADAQAFIAPDQSRAVLRVLQLSEVAPGSRGPIRVDLPDDRTYLVKELSLSTGETTDIGSLSGGFLSSVGLKALPPFASMGRLFILETAQGAAACD